MKEVTIEGVKWTDQDLRETMIPFILTAPNLERLYTTLSEETLFSIDFMLLVLSFEGKSRIIDVLNCQKKIKVNIDELILESENFCSMIEYL